MPHRLSREFCNPGAGDALTVNGKEYTINGKIGDGAAGLVRKATRLSDNQTLAIKLLAPDPKYLEEDKFDDVAARFKREGERGAALDYTHLIKIHAYCENENGSAFDKKQPDNPFLLMEYIHGRTLEEYILKYKREEQMFAVNRRTLHMAIQIACALEHLHKKKLIHRDVKPANIFVAKDAEYPLVKLGDFGIMKWGDFQSSLTTGNLTTVQNKGLGTLKYMSPEQALSPKDVTTSSDMYSFGVTLFELFTGRILAGPHNVFEVILARLNRGNAVSRIHSLGYSLAGIDEDIADLVLNLHLRGATGRPKISEVRGRLEYEYERRFDTSWKHDCVGF